MIKTEFVNFWKTNFEDLIPLSYMFRTEYPDRWVRFHNLPNSKRYPENDEEIAQLLNRQNSIIQNVLEGDLDLFFVTIEYVNSNSDLDDTFEMHPRLNLKKVREYNLFSYFPEDFELEDKIDVFASEHKWSNNAFDDILEDIANDAYRVFFVSKLKACIIAPYDGGIDIILPTEVERNYYKEKYKDWLSERVDGL